MMYALKYSSKTRISQLQQEGFRISAARLIVMFLAALVTLLLCMGFMPHTAFADDVIVEDTTLTITSDKTAYQAGDIATIQVTITNNTEETLTVATINATLPSQMSLVSGSLSNDAAGLEAGDSETFTFTAKIPDAGLAKASDNGGFVAIAVLTFGAVCAVAVLLLARKKKIVGSFAALTVVFCVFIALPSAAYGAAIGDMYEKSHPLTINGQSAEIIFEVETTYEGDLNGLVIEKGVVLRSPDATGAVKIPKIYEGYVVTEIADWALQECDIKVCEYQNPDDPDERCACINCVDYKCGCERKTAIRIPDTITKIGKFAFENCSALTSVVIPDSVTTIGEGAFKKCRGLTTTNIPGSVESLGAFVFELCSSLSDVEIAESRTAISKGLFKDCSALDNVIIPSAVTTIEEQAFLGTKLTAIHIPDAVEEIGIRAFESCASLESVTFGANPKTTELPDSVFSGCALEDFTIPSSVTSIGDNAFTGTKLTSIAIPDTVTEIGISAFEKCALLGEVNFDEDSPIKSIADNTFKNCKALDSINIPDGVEWLSDGAFQNCTSLASIDIPDSVEVIGKDAFDGCIALAQVNFGDGSLLGQIEDSAFTGCTSLKSFIMPKGVDSLFKSVFLNCSQLSSVVFQGVIPADPADTTIFDGTDANIILYYTADAAAADDRWETIYNDSDLDKRKVFGKFIEPYLGPPAPPPAP